MSDKGFGGRLLAFFSSLRLGVAVMVTIASVCGYATFYEMQHGTPAVQRDIYQTPWFALLLGLLGFNVLCVMVSRWPWSRHQVGFLVAHVGILAVLLGSVVSLYGGLDSSMVLAEGETSDRVRLSESGLEAALPFRVTLLDFNDEPYPGSRMASTFESRVRVDDPETGTFETVISMNHPLHHRGYVFFQSSYVEGRPMISILSVARAPGLPLVYAGTVLIGVGIAWMFYGKPWLAKRQAARALEARRTRERTTDEAKPAGPVSARA
jgi:hypothetical protein